MLAANNWNVCQYAVLMHMLAQVCDMSCLLYTSYELSKEARQQFLEYIVNHKKRLADLIIRKSDSGLLQSFLELKDDEENFIADVLAVTDMLALAAQDEWSEGSVILHRFKKENLSVSRKRRFEF